MDASEPVDRRLATSRRLTRRDFFNSTALGGGALLMTGMTPRQLLASTDNSSWDGYGGVGDYARSHGNSYEVLTAGHRVRDGAFDQPPSPSHEDEAFDLVVVGGGLSGLSAAYYFGKRTPRGSCLVLDNHRMLGGEAKRNEFRVGGHLLTGPQGSNSFPVPEAPGARGYDIYSELGIPRSFDYATTSSRAGEPYEFCRDNFEFQYWKDRSRNFGWFFENPREAGKPQWLRDIWSQQLQAAPYSAADRASLLAWRSSVVPRQGQPDFAQWLDTMTYRQLIEDVMGLSPAVTKYLDPIIATACSGLGSDVTSAYAAYQIAMPGLKPADVMAKIAATEQHSFPGGNDGFMRHFLKALLPSAIAGERSFERIMNGSIRFDELDRAGAQTRIRLGATVVRVEHDGPAGSAARAFVTYIKDGEVRRVRANAVVMAGGSWITRRVVRDLPEAHLLAYQQFHRAPLLVANVALRNWRFLDQLGLTACRWFDGFGYACNIRAPMKVGGAHAPLDPAQPAVLTFYVPLLFPGGSIQEQAARGRLELLDTSFQEYERRITTQMLRLFGDAGFKPRDIAAIVLNRWGHAYLCPQPGFYFGRAGNTAPRDVVRTPFGRIAFAHSELNGQQNYLAAIEEGRRAVGQVAAA
jgi:spermidine dehydrogenase